MTDAPLHPISATLMALRQHDPVLGVLAEVRETFSQATVYLWDEGISRYLKMRWDAIVNGYYSGNQAAASSNMDLGLANFDVAETVHRACDITDAPLMMEIVAYAMALATTTPGSHTVWHKFEAIIGHLYRQLPAPAVAA